MAPEVAALWLAREGQPLDGARSMSSARSISSKLRTSLVHTGYLGRPVDMWSFGVSILRMRTGRHLFEGDDLSVVCFYSSPCRQAHARERPGSIPRRRSGSCAHFTLTNLNAWAVGHWFAYFAHRSGPSSALTHGPCRRSRVHLYSPFRARNSSKDYWSLIRQVEHPYRMLPRMCGSGHNYSHRYTAHLRGLPSH